jgi:galactokinase
MLADSVLRSFRRIFTDEPLLVHSPGRINLIGEHTDYNEGYVFPAAIDRYIVMATLPSGSPGCRIVSLDTNRELEFSLADPPFRFPLGSWENYVIGCAWEIMEAGYDIGGFKMVFAGDIPPGAGLSSSAALENAVVFSLSELFGLDIPKEEMIRISQKAEHEYAGVHCGIMDQYTNMFGREGHALLIDCRSVRSLAKPLALEGHEIVLVNSHVKHALADSGYNERREECATGVVILQDIYPEIRALRDVTLQQLADAEEYMPPVVFDRCRYVVRENNRVLQSVLAIQAGDLDTFGEILLDAHNDMRYLYEITCPEIDHLVDMSSNHPDLLGCRMMGGGFGGCTLNLVKEGSAADIFDDTFRAAYRKRFDLDIELYSLNISDGIKIIENQ